MLFCVIFWIFNNVNNANIMEKNNMQYHVRQTLIHKDVYRPSPSLGRFAKFIFSIILMGQSPINHRADYDRRSK